MGKQQRPICPVEHAGGLDNIFRRWLQNPRKILATFVKEGMTVLDYGCGPGFFTLEMAQIVGDTGHIIAADLQAGMLEKVRTKINASGLEHRITLHQCDSHSLVLTRQLDFIFAFFVIHELPDQAAFFHEVQPLLQPEGTLLIVEPPIHVSKSAFEKTLLTAQGSGLKLIRRPKILLCKAALFGCS